MSANREKREAADEDVDDHLADIPPGTGCTEIWERLSEDREDAEE